MSHRAVRGRPPADLIQLRPAGTRAASRVHIGANSFAVALEIVLRAGYPANTSRSVNFDDRDHLHPRKPFPRSDCFGMRVDVRV